MKLIVDKISSELVEYGMPSHLLRASPVDLYRSLGMVVYNKNPVNYKRQANVFAKTLDDPSGRYVYSIAGQTDTRQPQIAASHLFQVAYDSLQGKPLWHSLSSVKIDKLSDKIANLGKVSMFVLDGIYENSTHYRLEKARDILELFYGWCPIVVVGAGLDPISLMQTRLFAPTNRFLYFGTSQKEVARL